MPFMKHIIEPINISQCPLPPGEPNELECLSNLTLANVIRQLSSLGQHAGRIFDELVQDAVKLNNRSQILTQRIENLKQKCTQLDIQNEEVSLEDFQTKKQFKNSIKIDQQVVSRKTMPEAMRLMYENADPPPALDKLNPYRSDGKDCMKFYTDPEFFFNIWCNELMKDNEARKNEKKRRKAKQNNIKSPINQTNNQHIQFVDQIQQKLTYESNYQHQTMLQQNLMNQAKQHSINLSLKSNTQNPLILQYQQLQDQKSYYINNNDAPLPPPPNQLLQPVNLLNNYQIYAESSQMNNGNRSSKLVVQQNARLTTQSLHNDRPMMPPPPPIPESNHLTGLQEIQEQIIRKFDRSLLNHDEIEPGGNDLPPPPSPPAYMDNNKLVNLSITHQMNSITISQKTNHNLDTPDSIFDMPLPPPPLELQDPTNMMPPPTPPSLSKSNPLPPPPPLPPLADSDTASSSTSSLSTSNTINTNQNSNTNKLNQEQSSKSSRSFLDDINKGRFVLKPTQKENNLDERRKINSVSDDTSRETIPQPFVNNSDVAAIIDFVRKFRPHVRDSSDDDEENSDWDD